MPIEKNPKKQKTEERIILDVKKQEELLETTWKTFNTVLEELMIPKVIDRSNTPKQCPKNQVTVAILTEPDFRLIAGLEGGKQAPGCVLLVFSPLWLEKRGSELYVHKGVWFDGQFQGYFESYFPPRRVTYFADFFTMSATEGVRVEGVQYEKGLECPMSSSAVLENFTNDKVHTRCLLGNAGVACPRTLAFPYQSSKKYYVGSIQMTIIPLEKKENPKSFYLNHLKDFLELYPDIKGVVVKPSGPLWMGSKGVKIFQTIEDIDSIVDAMYNLAQELNPGDCLMVDDFLPTVNSQLVVRGREAKIFQALVPAASTQLNQAAMEMFDAQVNFSEEENSAYNLEPVKVKLGFRLRALVARSTWNTPVVTQYVVGIGPINEPINGDNTMPQTLDSALDQWGITDPIFKHNLCQTIQSEAERTLQSIIDFEKDLSTEERGGKRAQTDLIGLDFILGYKVGVITPFVIEVNDHDCTLQAQMLELMLPRNEPVVGECVRPWVATMLNRSQRYLLKGKKVLVMGGGGTSKSWTWETAKELELHIILADHSKDHFARSLVNEFIHLPDLENHSLDKQSAKKIVQILKERNITVDGVITFWEDCAPIAAELASLLNLTGNSHEAHYLAKSKYRTHKFLLEKVGSWPHKVSTHYFAVPSLNVASVEDLEKALLKIPLPAVLKLDHGSSAVGVKLVRTKEEAISEYNNIINTVNEDVHPGSGLTFDTSVTLMEYIDGSEHDIDLVMWDGVVLASFVTDNGPTRLPYFTETVASMPTGLHRDKEYALKAAAFQCCYELGLRNGVFNVEMKLTATGPRLIEINARTGGFYIVDWMKVVWGVDLAACAYMIACGVKPIINVSPTPLTHIVGMNCVSSIHGEALKSHASLERLKEIHKSGAMRANFFEKDVVEPDEYEEPIVNIACTGESTQEAKAKLLSTLAVLGLDCGNIPASWYLQYIK